MFAIGHIATLFSDIFYLRLRPAAKLNGGSNISAIHLPAALSESLIRLNIIKIRCPPPFAASKRHSLIRRRVPFSLSVGDIIPH